MKNINWRLQALAVLAVSYPLSLLPCRFGERLGLLLFHVWKSRRLIAIDNLKKSDLVLSNNMTPESIVRESFRNIGRSFIEIIKVYYGRGDAIMDKTEINSVENYLSAKAKGKGVIVITGHCSNWELLPLVSSSRSESVSGVARPLNNPYINSILERARSRYGSKIIYKKGALKSVIATLRGGGIVGILMDQSVLPNEGFMIDFLGRKAWTTKMPAIVARKTGAAVLPVFIRRVKDGYVIDVHPEIELSENPITEEAVLEDTKRFSGYIEDNIRQNPSEWLWLHRRWKRA